jgi:asparagine synthase (glutamine-hydrolysing)
MAAVNAMVDAMHHRGPDDAGTFFDSIAGLGMTRLAIIDTSNGGHQPMQTPDGLITLVYNGELYNFRELRELLTQQGYRFKSNSDTEVVLRMYEQYGDDFLLRLRGMFALALYDKRRGRGKERLLLARDQMGIKPLLYTRARGLLIFASEVKALLASGLVNRDIDPESLRLLLVYGSISQPRTILRNVKMLPAAHRLIVTAQGEKLEQYWSLGLDRRAGLRQATYSEQVEELRRVLQESVRLQMVADVPLGAFLSGGVDSSLLVALMAREVSGERVKTFSVGFESEGSDIDESDEANAAADFIGTDHQRVVVTGNEVRDRIETIARALDQPSVDGVNSYFVSQAARRGVTVAISGTGGDELFAGYPWFALMANREASLHGPAWKMRAREMLAPLVRASLFDEVNGRIRQWRYTSDFRTRYTNATAYNIFATAGAKSILARDLRTLAGVGRSPFYDLPFPEEMPEGSVIDRVTSVSLRSYTTNQLLRDIDAVSMAHSLEVRVPYLDPFVADTALSLPDEAKLQAPEQYTPQFTPSYRDSGTKRILLDVAQPYLPPGYDLKPKRGFGMPFGAWMKGPLRDVLADALSDQSVRRRAWFDAPAVADLRDSFFKGAIGWPQPWLLMMIELWCREVLDQATSESNCLPHLQPRRADSASCS